MTEDLKHSAHDEAHHRLPTEALARRSMLLKSLGKGSVVLAATAVPMHTLATTVTVTKDGKRCSISGMQSGVNSQVTDKRTCSGKSPGYWHNYDRWIHSQKRHCDDKFGVLFRDPSCSRGHHTLKEFVCSIGSSRTYGPRLNNTDEWHWCGAWMNAKAGLAGMVEFPYTPEQVIDIYNDPRKYHTTRSQALEFFKKLEG